MAATVLLLALSSSIVALQGSFRMLDISRGLTLSSQIAQSEIERIRLDDWSHLPASGTVDISSTFSADPVLASKFSALRTISDTPGKVGSMKDIVIDVTWRTSDDKVHSRAYKAQYAKKGIYDYDYTKAR